MQVAPETGSRYSRIWFPEKLHMRDRRIGGFKGGVDRGEKVPQPWEPAECVDPFHTPEGKPVGLRRRLTVGAFVTKDGRLEQRQLADYQGLADAPLGAVSACIPFLRNNDPRRILM